MTPEEIFEKRRPQLHDPRKEPLTEMIDRVMKDDDFEWAEESRPLNVFQVTMDLLLIGNVYTEGEVQSPIGGVYVATTIVPGLRLRQTQASPMLFEVIPDAPPQRERWAALRAMRRRIRNAWWALAGKDED